MIIVFLVTIVVAALIELVPPFAFRRILDHSIPTSDRHAITVLAGVRRRSRRSSTPGWPSCSAGAAPRIGEGLIYDLRVALFAKVQRMPIAFFTRTQTGALTSRLNNDVVGAQTAVTSTLGSVVSNVVVLDHHAGRDGGARVAAHPARARRAADVHHPGQAGRAPAAGHPAPEHDHQRRDEHADDRAVQRRRCAAREAVRPSGRRDRHVLAAAPAKVRDTGIRAAMYGRVFFVALGLVGALGAAAIYGVGAHLVGQRQHHARHAGRARRAGHPGVPAAHRAHERPRRPDDRDGQLRAGVRGARRAGVRSPTGRARSTSSMPVGRVEFDDVWFRYPAAADVTVRSLEAPSAILGTDPDRDVLHGVSLIDRARRDRRARRRLRLGQDHAVGPHPAALRRHRRRGAASTGTTCATSPSTACARRSAWSSQDPHLFHETIGANLRYAKPDATLAELDEACRGARILDMIAELPDGYDTVVGERGYRLSGGEKQRLAIARLLLKNPAVMILDEATSHLDNENEAHVQAALDEALRGRTALVIAHRLSTIRDADRIVVLDDGRIVEQGTHDELMRARRRVRRPGPCRRDQPRRVTWGFAPSANPVTPLRHDGPHGNCPRRAPRGAPGGGRRRRCLVARCTSLHPAGAPRRRHGDPSPGVREQAVLSRRSRRPWPRPTSARPANATWRCRRRSSRWSCSPREQLGAATKAVDAALAGRQQLIDQQLGEVQHGMTELQRLTAARPAAGRSTAQKFGQVDRSLQVQAEVTQALASTTNSLREALASSNARGQWGERMAEDVLRLAGLLPNVNYVKRTAVAGEGRGIPDFTFLLPEGHVLFMDVKFPMDAYLRFLAGHHRGRARAHRASSSATCAATCASWPGATTRASTTRPAVDNVLMFVPNETIVGFIHEHAPALIDEAMREHVVICSPLTLFAFLGVIRQAFDNFRLEQTSQEMLGLLGQVQPAVGQVHRPGRQGEAAVRHGRPARSTSWPAPVAAQLERPLARPRGPAPERHVAVDGELFAIEPDDDSTMCASSAPEPSAGAVRRHRA